MHYTMTTPCDACPFLKKYKHAFTMGRLEEMASAEFHCHKIGTTADDGKGSEDFVPTADSHYCAGALIFLEKRDEPNQMMRIAERLGLYDRRKLNMRAPVR
jgi:hypothetical protein